MDKLVFSENQRFLLWRNGISREEWSKKIRDWLDADIQRARNLLVDAEPRSHEIEILADQLEISEAELRFSNLLADSGVDLFVENLSYLLAAGGRGKKKKLAADLEMHQTTISRWLSGTQRPDKGKLVEIGNHFGVDGRELIKEPYFLSLMPVADEDKRQWLIAAIAEADRMELKGLFPALYKLLSDR